MKIQIYLLPLLFSFYSFISFAQDAEAPDKTSSEIERIDKKIQECRHLASSDPNEATKKLLKIKEQCKKINYKTGAMQSSMVLVLLYYNGGNYKKTIEELQFVEKYAVELQNNEYRSDIYRMRSITYGEMGLLNESINELEKAIPYAEKIESPIKKSYKKALIYESYAGVYTKNNEQKKELHYRQKSVQESEKMPESPQAIINAKYQNIAYQYASIGLVYSNLKVNDSADYYFKEALNIYENEKYNIYINGQAVLLSDMAKFYNDNGSHDKAILYGKRAEAYEKQAPMPYIRKSIFHSLFSSYMETTKKDSSKYYLKLYTALNDSLLKSEKEDVMTPVNQIISDKEAENKITVRNILTLSALALAFFIVLGWVYWYRTNKIVHKKYEVLITRIENEKQHKDFVQESQENDSLNEDKTSINIADETTIALLSKLEKFEASKKFLKKNISRTWLANRLNTNPRYLSEIIKTQRDKTFTSYINGLRINYVTRKLVEDPLYREYKINYLAEECGYASSQVFVIAFKKETGLTPSYFIEKLKRNSEGETSIFQKLKSS